MRGTLLQKSAGHQLIKSAMVGLLLLIMILVCQVFSYSLELQGQLIQELCPFDTMLLGETESRVGVKFETNLWFLCYSGHASKSLSL